MYARMTTFHIQDGKFDEAIEVIREQIVPAVREQPGFRHVSVLGRRAQSRGVVIVYYDSEQAVREIDARGFWESQVAHGIFLIASVPVREEFDVVVHE